MRHREGEVDGRLADLGGHAESDDGACDQGIALVASYGHAVHEVEGGDSGQSKDDVDCEEVAQLDVDDCERQEHGRHEPDTPPVQARAEEVCQEHGCDVRQRGDAAPDESHVVRDGQEFARNLEEIRRETAVGEPAWVPWALFGVEEVGDITEGREGQRIDEGNEEALVWMRRIPVSVVPVDAVQPERKRGGHRQCEGSSDQERPHVREDPQADLVRRS